jgi:hypothetical protein
MNPEHVTILLEKTASFVLAARTSMEVLLGKVSSTHENTIAPTLFAHSLLAPSREYDVVLTLSNMRLALNTLN